MNSCLRFAATDLEVTGVTQPFGPHPVPESLGALNGDAPEQTIGWTTCPRCE